MMSALERTLRVASFLSDDPVQSAKTGQSPHDVIFRMGCCALRYFAAQPVGEDAEGVRRPVLISMPLINTWTIFDLLPGRSVVESLTTAGFPVYLVDWGRPRDADAHRPLSYYIDDVLGRMFDRARRHAVRHGGDGALDAVGYCVGGTFLAAHLSRNPTSAVRVAFVATPIDFHASGRLSRWASEGAFPLDALIDGVGNYPADLMRLSFACLKPSSRPASWMGLWERIDRDGFPGLWAALEQWSADNVDFPGEAYREYVRRCYFDNALMAGGWRLGTRVVDLSAARIPARVIQASRDHIAPPAACSGLRSVWGGPVDVVTLRGGHVGICVGTSLPTALVSWLSSAITDPE